MITANNNIDLSSAQQKDKFVIVGGKDNLVVDSRKKVYPMGGVAPTAAPSAEVITGGGALTPNIGYSYAYSYLNTYQDSETEPSPASAYIGREDEGKYKTVRFSSDGLTVYISGSDLRKEDDYYQGQTLAIEIANDEYKNIYSQWQYRSVKEYTYNAIEELGAFVINRPFFNVDPDEADQVYNVKIEDLETESGIVGGQSKGKDKLILDPSASQTPSDYRYKTIHIVSGKGRGQKRIIIDASQREDGLIEITVDTPWKQKPKYLDDEKKDLYRQREQAEGKGTNRKKNFYKQNYSSEYVISDPLRYNGLALDCNVISYDDKGRRVRLSGLGHSGDLITGKVVSYTDSKGKDPDEITIVLDGEADMSTDVSYENKRIRVYDGAGAGLDANINKVKKASDNRVVLKIDVFGKMKKKDIPNGSSKVVIYGGEPVSSSMIAEVSDTKVNIFPRVFGYEDNQDGTYTLICCGKESQADSQYLCACEANNVETYNNGRCYIMFQVESDSIKKDGVPVPWYISRPIVSATSETITEKVKTGQTTTEERTYERLKIVVSDLPSVAGQKVRIHTQKNYPVIDKGNECAYFVYSDSLQDGIYTGWIAAFYNTSDNFSKGKKKVRTARVAGYLDATGELLLCNGVAGVGEGWQCVLYSEYTRQFGSRVKAYAEDSYNPSYTSTTNSRYFLLDYFASGIDDYYKGWKFEFLYGTAKKVKGKTIYAQDKNKKQYTVYAYDGTNKRIDCAGDENYAKGVRMKPAPAGNEFVTLYDPSSYIFRVFNSDDDEDANSESEGNNSSSDGIKMKVSGIIKSQLQGFDKIRLYRASESTETYRLCATLENETQTYIDNAAESELTTELDFAHSAPNPTAHIASRNARFALAGAKVDNFTASLVKGSYIATQSITASAYAKKGIGYASQDYLGTVTKSGPMIGANLSKDVWLSVDLLNEGMTDCIDLHLLIGKPADDANGVICSLDKRLEQSTLDNKVFWFESPIANPTKADFGSIIWFDIPESYGEYGTDFAISSIICNYSDINGEHSENVPFDRWSETRIDYTATWDSETRKMRIEGGSPWYNYRLTINDILIVRSLAEPETETANIEVSDFYLNPSASGQDNGYANATLRIVDADGIVRHLRFGEDIKYKGEERKVSLISGTIKLKFRNADLGIDYITDDSSSDVHAETKKAWLYEPAVYSIYNSTFQVYYKGGLPYYWDGARENKLTATLRAGSNVAFLTVPVPAIVSNNMIRLVFGGTVNARMVNNVLGHTLYYLAVANRYNDNPPLASYCLSDLTFAQKWDWKIRKEVDESEEGKPFASCASLQSGGKSAYLYVAFNSNKEPKVKAKQIRQIVPTHNLIVFDKPNREVDGNTTFFVKDNALEVQITTAGAGLREKVELADTYNFNDGYGTKITGIVDCRIGFVIFKDRGVYVLDPDKRVFQCVSHEFGCIAPGSIAEGRGGIFWLSNGGRIEYQDFDNGNAVRDVGRGLRPWFDGDETIGGHSVDWSRVEGETAACFDSDYGDYLISIPTKKNNLNSNVILVFNEEFNQWWRIDDDQSHNSVKCAFQFEGRGAFAGINGIYYMKPDTSYINPWRYESRWRDDGANDVEKLVRRVKFNNFVDTSRSDNPVGNVDFYKDQKTTAEPNFLNWASIGNNTSHAFYTNQSKAQVETGVRGYIWKFVMYGLSYIKMKSMDVVVRKKEDNAPFLENSPNDNNNS